MSTFTSTGILGPRAKFAGLLLGGLAGIIAAGAASAAGIDSDAPSVSVKYSETSLATDRGVNDLYRRITVAAKQVCPGVPAGSILGLAAQFQVSQCREQAIAKAISQIGNAQLAALHATSRRPGRPAQPGSA